MISNIKIQNILKYIFLFIVGGAIYYFAEVLFRGHSHWSMFLLGGVVFLFAGEQNEVTEWEESFWKQLFKVWFFTIASEFVVGCWVNLIFKWNVWDYSNLPGNLFGQVSWQFALIFLPLCAFGIVLDDYLRWIFFGEGKPHYVWTLQDKKD